MAPATFSADMRVGRFRVVYARDGHMRHASELLLEHSLRMWDYLLKPHGGLAGISGRDGALVPLCLWHGDIYLN